MAELSSPRRTSRPSVERPRHTARPLRFIATFGGAAAILIAGAITYFATERAEEDRALVAQAHAVIEMAVETMSAVQAAETGQRGFLITGDTAYLRPYVSALSVLSADTLALRQLAGDNPSQQRRIDTLDALIVRKLGELEETIAHRKRGSLESVATVVRSGRGKAMMDSIRTMIDAIADEERRLLEARSRIADRSARLAVTVLVAGTLAAIVCALVLNWMLSRFAAEQSRAAQRLAEQMMLAEAANAAKSDFLAGVSHELRTPLNAIDGYTELLLLGVRGELTALQRGDVERIKKSSRHLLTLINQVLNLAKVESGHIDVNLAVVAVRSLLQDVEVLIQTQMAAKSIAFTVGECDPETRVHADPDRVRQILLNLVSNAQKFTDAGGRVTMSCQPGDRGVLHIDVTDTGRGVPADKLGEIFEPFTQLNRLQTPDAHRGIGLGLSISRTLAHAMNGDLTVESEVGKGSTFRLSLPRSG